MESDYIISKQGRSQTLPKDIRLEIERVAVSEQDRDELIRIATGIDEQVARAIVVISEGSVEQLFKVFKEYPALNSDWRDILAYAHDMVDYDAGYFTRPFHVIQRRKKGRRRGGALNRLVGALTRLFVPQTRQ
ncbi:MAG: hypothetical protein U0176_18680 [Bacteroidia bacterium]